MFLETKKEGEVTLEPWRELLLKAADEMERRGHCTGKLMDPDGRVCIFGALNMADHGHIWNDRTPLAEAVVSQMKASLQGMCPSLYNDSHSQAECLAFMRTCARS